jgi:DNA-binding NarL/FixJ family response regulator
MASLRILIADEHYLMRHGLKLLVESHPGWTICGEARTGSEAVSAAKKLKPDIAILAMSMPELNGLEATKRIKTASPNTEILIRSGHGSAPLIQEILGAGARSFILDTDSDRDLVVAVETIANQETHPTPLTPETANSPSATALEDRTDIEAIQRGLAELIALVQQPLRQQFATIDEGKPEDPTARDYILEELFAIAVRFCEMDGGISERVAHSCWEIFTYLAPSKYDGLTPATMTELMSTMATRVPQRYDSELQSSSFLLVDLLSHSDRALGTNHAEHLRDCLFRFRRLLWRIHGSSSTKEECESREVAEVLKIEHVAVDAVPRTEEEPRLPHRADPLQIAQELLEPDRTLTTEENSVTQDLASHGKPPILVRILTPIIDGASTSFRTVLRGAIGIFLRIPQLLQNVKQWLKAPMK